MICCWYWRFVKGTDTSAARSWLLEMPPEGAMRFASRPVLFSIIILAVCALPARPSFSAREVPGNISFVAPIVLNSPVAFPDGIAAGDFNNDGVTDLAVVSESDSGIYVALGNQEGGGRLSFGPWLGSDASYSPSVLALGKFDGHNLDAVVNDEDYPEVSVLFGSGDGYFPTGTSLGLTGGNRAYAGGIAVGDFNGDGNNDLAFTNGLGDVDVYLGDNGGDLDFAGHFPTRGGVPTQILAADFNGDGKLDLAVLNAGLGSEPASIAVLLGKGDGKFESPLLFKFQYRDPHVPCGIAVGDFNRDGKLDLAVPIANEETDVDSYVLILLGNGDGSFHRGVLAPAGIDPDSVVVADFNGDGKLDIAVANAPCAKSCGELGYVSVLLGRGDGTFRRPATFAVNGKYPGYLITADFNGDGKPDLATSNGDSNTISILLNTTPFLPQSRH
jgi:FG-GAP-like repeat